MPGDGPRLRTALDARALVLPERDAVTGRLAAHSRQRKHDRPRRVPKKLHRHLLRTPAGIAGAAVVVAAAIGGVTVAATAGSDTPADRSSEPRGQVTEPGVLAPPAGTPDGQPPPPCDIITAAEASRIMGTPMRNLAKQTGSSCTYWGSDPTAQDNLMVGWSLATELDAVRQFRESSGVAVHDVPELGGDAFAYPSKTTEDGAGGRTWDPAAVHFTFGGIHYFVALGHADKEFRAIDPAGDEQLALVTAEDLLSDLESGAIEVS